jgi:hypothetical protein
VIQHAIETDSPQLRYPCSWGGEAIATSRKTLDDNQWIDMMRATDDEDYNARFQAAFGVDIRLP